MAERSDLARMNGKDSVSVTVLKQSDANTVQVAQGVREALHELTGQVFLTNGKEAKYGTRGAGPGRQGLPARAWRCCPRT